MFGHGVGALWCVFSVLVESELITSAQSSHFTHLLDLGQTGLESQEILMRGIVRTILCDVAQVAGGRGLSFRIYVSVSGF